jgi:hypothetical protein
MDRREFLAKAGVAVTWTGIAIRVSACGDGDGGTGPDGNGSVNGTISSNHGHAVTVTQAQLLAGQAVTLTLDGPSDDHTHTVQLSSLDVEDIAGGLQVSVSSSSDDGHFHVVTFN